MRACRSYSLAALLIPFVLVACSSKEAAPPPPEQSKQVEPSRPQAAPATTDAPKADAEPSPSSGAGAQKAAPAQPAPSSSAVPAPPPAAPNKELPALPGPGAPTPPAPVTQAQAPPSPTPPKVAPPNVVILKASIGGVRFEHKTHSETRKIPCATCHHASRPEEPGTSPQQACRQCHTPVAALPMKTKLQAAFHNPTGTKGACIDCHKASNAKGLSAPVKCLDCHKKENK